MTLRSRPATLCSCPSASSSGSRLRRRFAVFLVHPRRDGYVCMVLRFLFNAALRMLMLAALIYVTFFVPIGEHTLYKHAVRIGGTPEAQELWSAVVDVGTSAGQRLTDAISNRASAQAEGQPAPQRP